MLLEHYFTIEGITLEQTISLLENISWNTVDGIYGYLMIAEKFLIQNPDFSKVIASIKIISDKKTDRSFRKTRWL